jgi:hypothetical protein
MTTAAGADSMSLFIVDPPWSMGLGGDGWGLDEVELKETDHVVCGLVLESPRAKAIRPPLSGTDLHKVMKYGSHAFDDILNLLNF